MAIRGTGRENTVSLVQMKGAGPCAAVAIATIRPISKAINWFHGARHHLLKGRIPAHLYLRPKIAPDYTLCARNRLVSWVGTPVAMASKQRKFLFFRKHEVLIDIIAKQLFCTDRLLLIVHKDNHMKKLLALGAALSLISAQAFAQTAQTPAAGSAPATAAPAAAAPVAAAPAAAGPLAGLSAATGLSTAALVAVGVGVAAVAVTVADSDSSTAHSTTTHH
jgi:hypothetical protein